jgi:flagellar basal-body rod protein FlgC
MFNSIDTSGTGLATYQTWLDAIANNIANVNDESPTSGPAFQATFVQAQALPTGPDGVGTGVEVTGLLGSSPQGDIAYDPDNPLADAQGNIRRPDIDMSQQMGDLIMAQRAFQANAQAINQSSDMYKSAIAIGKGI